MKRLANSKALHNYQIQDRLEAGIVLFGGEVKSIKLGRASLTGSFVQIHEDALYLTNAHIPEYQPGQGKHYDPYRDRKLLVHTKEISRLIGLSKAQGLTMVPLALYGKGGLIKVEIGVARGKSNVDKRRDLKAKEVKRQIQRKLRQKI